MEWEEYYWGYLWEYFSLFDVDFKGKLYVKNEGFIEAKPHIDTSQFSPSFNHIMLDVLWNCFTIFYLSDHLDINTSVFLKN